MRSPRTDNLIPQSGCQRQMHPIAAAAESSFPVAWEAQAAQDPGWPGGPSLAVTAAFTHSFCIQGTALGLTVVIPGVLSLYSFAF